MLSYGNKSNSKKKIDKQNISICDKLIFNGEIDEKILIFKKNLYQDFMMEKNVA